MSIASEIAAQIEDLENANARLHDQIDTHQQILDQWEQDYADLDNDYDAFKDYAESITPGIVKAYLAQKELTR